MAKSKYPEIYIIMYRGIRSAVGAGIAQAVLLQPDWSDPEQAWRTLGVAFLAGFIPSLGKYIRDVLDAKFGYDEKSTIARIMPI